VPPKSKRGSRGRSPHRITKPGPKPSITLAVVKRICEAYGRGVSLDGALAAEGNDKINLETWKKALAAHPEFSPHWQGARGKFLAKSMARLERSKNLKFLCWLLERRHSDLFSKRDSKPSDVPESERERNSEIPDDVWQRARELARGDARPTKEGTHGTK